MTDFDARLSEPIRMRPARAVLAVLAFAFALGFGTRAFAQVGVSALPSVYNVPWLERPTKRLRLAAGLGYGGFGDILEANDTHHRLLAGLGAAYQRAGFGVEARLDTRYDKHNLDSGSDSGAVLDPRVALRYAKPVSERFSLGGQLGLWFPGKDFPKPAFAATSVDLLALGTLHGKRGYDMSFALGYRIDSSDKAVDHPERLSPADFAAIGLSSFDAVLVGLGLRADFGTAALLVELGSDVLVGSGAPSFAESPSHLGAGADIALGDHGTRMRLLLNTSLSARPTVDVNGPLVPMLPRVWFVAALTQDLLVDAPPTLEEQAMSDDPEPVIEAEPPPPDAVDEPAIETPRGVIRVLVRDTDWGEPLEATVTVTSQGGEAPTASGRTTRLSEGLIELPVSPGRYEVLIESKGYAPQRRNIVVDEGGVTVLNVDLRPKEKS